MMASTSDKPEVTRFALHHCVLCGAILTHDGKVCSVRCALLVDAREQRQGSDMGRALDQQYKLLQRTYQTAVNTSAPKAVLEALDACMTAHDKLQDLWMRGGR